MLAIVIPYYNYKYLEFTLDSLSKQTNKNFNLYIGDDNSPNNPEILIDKYRNVLKIKYVRFDSNIGKTSLVKQWERCINLIEEETWIQILGDDDVLSENCVDAFFKHIGEIKKNNFKLIRFASRYVDHNGVALANYKDYFHPKIQKSTDSYFLHFKGESRSSLSEHIFNRISYNKYKFFNFPLAWHSDDKAWLDFTNCGNLYTINEALVEVRLSNNNISGKTDNLKFKQKARFLFFKDLVFNKIKHFKKYQRTLLLLEFGVLMKKEDEIDFKNIFRVVLQLLKTGNMYAVLKFVTRMAKAKLNL